MTEVFGSGKGGTVRGRGRGRGRPRGRGRGGGRGREAFGLRFASLEREEMLDYEGAELLLIAARAGEEGLEKSLGEGRGKGVLLGLPQYRSSCAHCAFQL